MAAAASSLLCSSVRLVAQIRFRPVCKRITRLVLTSRRWNTVDSSNPPADHFSSGLDTYRDLQRYFYRRLKTTYRRFSNLPDHSVVCGHCHVYFVDHDGIYRMDKRQRDVEPEQVLHVGQVPGGEEETGPKNEERKKWIIQRIRLSPWEKHLAVTLKTNHGDELRCMVVRLEGKISAPSNPSHITLDNIYTFEWATDDVLFFTTLEGLRCSRVFRLDLTSAGHSVTSVYEDKHPDVFVEVALSRDRQILSINCSSRSSSEVLLVDTATTQLEPLLVQARGQDLLYHIEHWRHSLIILANTGHGQEYQVVQAPLSEPSLASWVPLFAPGPGSTIKDMDVVGDYCVLTARPPSGELVLTVVPLIQPENSYTVQLPSWACTIETKRPGLADECNILEFFTSSPVHPPTPYTLYLEKGLLVPGTKMGSDPEDQDNYTITRLEARSQDGALVPVTLFHAAPLIELRQAPLLAHVYGAYGRDLPMDFCPEKRLLLEQGWALAYCHIRGGGERGLSWQRQGRKEGKQKGVEDLEACLQHLFSSGVSSPSRTALTACSAGAVPVGALCNRRPHVMRAVTLQAPFLDVLGTMENPSLPLTLEDREEWGDPIGDPKHRLSIASYCPLLNITPQRYPSVLLTARSSDARVPLAGVLRYAEKLRNAVHTHCALDPEPQCKPAPNIVLNVQPGASHLGEEDFERRLQEEALNLAFLHKELGLDPPRQKRKRS